ncbi:MAG TPA: hypothetical protein DCP53_08805 [Elusimicrobia bacterium]|nr:MAG: hypothetical protein A2551_06445 [Elusimicrobia bacterium RIFOXYD2_FULL_34_30]HAM39474.1 hypothetical protein [Elusimicrobiota bacterium]
MKKLIYFVSVILFLFNSLLCAQTIDDVLRKMEKADSELTDLSFSLIQEVFITITQEKSSITGNAVFKKPDLFKIEYAKPEKQIIVCDGKKIFFYQKEFNQVMIEDWKSLSDKGNFPKGIYDFSSTIADLRKKYDISLIKDEGKNYIISLVLKEKQMQNMVINLWVSKENYLIEKTEIKTDTVVSTVSMSDIKINKGIKDSVFKFKIPKGASIITSPF